MPEKHNLQGQAREAPQTALRDLRFAGTVATGLVAGTLGLGALAAPLVGLLGVGAVPMALVVAGGMVAATGVLFLVVLPHAPVTSAGQGTMEPRAGEEDR
jgi:hypothetical protein